MDRREFFGDQIVDPTDLTGLETAIEAAIGRVATDHLQGSPGVITGLLPSQSSVPDLHVQVSSGVAYDSSVVPQRISVPVPIQGIDLSHDLNGIGTVPSVGLFRWVTLTVRQARNSYDPRTQADGTLANFRNDESYAFEVFAGAIAASATAAAPPAIPLTNVILGEWIFASGQTQVLDTGRSIARRNPNTLVGLAVGLKDAVAQLAAGVYNNCLVAADTPWSMNVRVLSGRINTASGTFQISGQRMLLTAPAANPKLVLVYVDQSGVLQHLDGAEAPTPVPPSHVVGVPLAHVLLRPGDTFFDATKITDVRPFIGQASGSIARQVSRTVATSGQVVFPLGFTFATDQNVLDVYKNGSRLDSTQYAETGNNAVTLNSGATAGDVVVVEAFPAVGFASVGPHASTHANGGSDPIDYSSLNGLRSGGDLRNYDLGASVSGQGVRISPLSIISSGKLWSNGLPAVVATSDVTFFPPGGVVGANTWYYLYAAPLALLGDQIDFITGSHRVSGSSAAQAVGNVGFLLTINPPEDSHRTMASDARYVFLGALRAQAANFLLPQFKYGRDVTYVETQTEIDAYGGYHDEVNVAVNINNGYAPIFYSLAQWVPPHARIARLLVDHANATGTGPGNTRLLTPLDSGAPGGFGIVLDTPDYPANFELVLDSQQRFVGNSSFGPSANAYVYVMGYRE